MQDPDTVSKVFIEVALRYLSNRSMGVLHATAGGDMEVSSDWLKEIGVITQAILVGAQQFTDNQPQTQAPTQKD